jgi:biopolymer transport protein ExbB
MWEIVQAGGALMWPIILCSIVAAAIILERLWTLQDRRVLPPDLTRKVWKLVEANQINDKVIAALEQNSPLGKLLAAGLANRDRPREVLMERLEDTGRHVVHELERFLNTLGTIAGVSPLLGLLGTVTGMMNTFGALGTADIAANAGKITGGVGEALIATACGLGIAILCLFPYNVLNTRIEQARHDISDAANALEIMLKQSAPPAP